MHALSITERVANLVSAEADNFFRDHDSRPPEVSSATPEEVVFFVPSSADLSVSQAKKIVLLGKLFRTGPTINVPTEGGGTSSLELDYDPARCQLGAYVLHAVKPRDTEEGTLTSDPHLKHPRSSLYAVEVVEVGIGYMFRDADGREAGDYKVCIRAGRGGTGPLEGSSTYRYHGFGQQPDIRATGQTNPKIAATLNYLKMFRHVADRASR